MPRRRIDFYGPHVTHNIPSELAKRGLSWFKMDVHWSEPVLRTHIQARHSAKIWSSELAYLRYGLGNFYSIDGIITIIIIGMTAFVIRRRRAETNFPYNI